MIPKITKGDTMAGIIIPPVPDDDSVTLMNADELAFVVFKSEEL
jgi:hypothetical protein